MSIKSLVYKNIYWYRLILNILYLGKYKKRFQKVCELIEDNVQTVNELCFGDIHIAKYCKDNGIEWRGYDLNRTFVSYAKERNFNAHCVNILEFKDFQKVDLFIIQGSLYHFHKNISPLFDQIFLHSKRLIIAEPIKNVSQMIWPFSLIGRKMSNAGNGDEGFRYTQETLEKLVEDYKDKYNYKIDKYYLGKDMMLDLKC